MIIAVVGAINGAIHEMYEAIFDLEVKIDRDIDWVICTGSFGIWPDPARADRGTRKHGDIGDFAKMYLNSDRVPRSTLFISGKHEDHRWLDLRKDKVEMELIPGLHWLVNGYKTTIGNTDCQFSIVGLGKVFSPTTYANVDLPTKRKIRHYTRREVERACSQGPTDLLLTHEAAAGTVLGKYNSNAKGIANICYATQPKLLVTGSSMTNNPETYLTAIHTSTLSMCPRSIVPLEYDGRKFKFISSS